MALHSPRPPSYQPPQDALRGTLTNKDVREALHTADAPHRHRLSAAVGRLLKRLHVRQLAVKAPRTRRWRVTETGRRVLGDTLAVYRRYSTQAA